QDFFRVFLVPGMGHCKGGPGTDKFDAVSVLAAWVERGQAPDRITAVHQTAGSVDSARPLCPFPQEARYSGSGDREDAASYVCAAGPQSTPSDGAWLRTLQEQAAR